jgi:hypothetical protein
LEALKQPAVYPPLPEKGGLIGVLLEADLIALDIRIARAMQGN